MPLKKYQESQDTKLVLIGFSGTGKTTLSMELNKLLNIPVFSIDSIIEKQYGKVSTIFSELGENAFRDLESKVLYEAITNKTGIIDCGGGVVEREENMILLQSWGKIIWLYCPLELIVQRTKDSDRPLLKGKDNTELKEFYLRRNELYEKYHQYKIDTSKPIAQITQEVLEIVI